MFGRSRKPTAVTKLSESQLRELTARIGEVSIKTASTSALADYLQKRFGKNKEQNIQAMIRLFTFYLWCARRAIHSYASKLSCYAMLMDAFDMEVMRLARDMASGDRKATEAFCNRCTSAFVRFDQAFDGPSGGDYVPRLGYVALEYIVGDVKGIDPLEELMLITLPASAVNDIHKECAQLAEWQ